MAGLSGRSVRITLTGGRLQLISSFRCPTCYSEFRDQMELRHHTENCVVLWEKAAAAGLSRPPNIGTSETLTDEQSPAQPAPDQDDDSFLGPDESGIYICSICDFGFADANECKQHLIQEHVDPSDCSNRAINENMTKVVEAGKQAEIRSNGTHENPDKYRCTICHCAFTGQSDLFEHMVSAHDKRLLYECPLCHELFSSRIELTRHCHGHKSANLKTTSNAAVASLLDRPYYECEFCGKGFAFASFLRRHVATHTAECYYTCDICGDQFRSQGNLVLHRAKHTGETLHPCPRCGKVFPYRSYLERHYRTHIADAMPCRLCGKVFNIPSQLRRHMNTDHCQEESNVCCPYCDRKFLYPSYLERHLAVHLQSRHHECPVCHSQFNARCALLNHLQRHVPESSPRAHPYKCGYCKTSYRHESNLEKHLHRVHSKLGKTFTVVADDADVTQQFTAWLTSDDPTLLVNTNGDVDNAA